MTERDEKAASRLVSWDMSPEAIVRRLDVLAELHELAHVLRRARYVENVETHKSSRSGMPGNPACDESGG